MKQPEKGDNFSADDKKRLRELIDSVHEWPSIFMFKFILPTDVEEIKKLKLIFDESAEITSRQSKSRKYTSITVKEMVMKGDHIFDRYEKASKIKGIISL